MGTPKISALQRQNNACVFPDFRRPPDPPRMIISAWACLHRSHHNPISLQIFQGPSHPVVKMMREDPLVLHLGNVLLRSQLAPFVLLRTKAAIPDQRLPFRPQRVDTAASCLDEVVQLVYGPCKRRAPRVSFPLTTLDRMKLR